MKIYLVLVSKIILKKVLLYKTVCYLFLYKMIFSISFDSENLKQTFWKLKYSFLSKVQEYVRYKNSFSSKAPPNRP